MPLVGSLEICDSGMVGDTRGEQFTCGSRDNTLEAVLERVKNANDPYSLPWMPEGNE